MSNKNESEQAQCLSEVLKNWKKGANAAKTTTLKKRKLIFTFGERSDI
jgi:hypothetical protein